MKCASEHVQNSNTLTKVMLLCVNLYVCMCMCVRAGNHFTIVYQSHIQAHMA